MKPLSKAELEALAEKIRALVSQNPAKAARLLTEWSKLPAGKSSKSEPQSASKTPKSNVKKSA